MSIPNILTLIRFLCIPAYIASYFSQIEHSAVISLCIFLFAMILDVLDGLIARKFNMVTDVGKVMDPIADKALIISVVACLVTTDDIESWFLYFIMAKEIIQIFGWALIYKGKKTVIPSNIFGKLATFLMFLFLVDAMSLDIFHIYLEIGAVVSTVLAFIMYSTMFVKIKFKNEGN